MIARPPPVARSRTIAILIVLLILLAFAGALVYFITVAVKTQLFGLFSIRREWYYPQIVRRIASDPAFIRELGAPVVVNDAGVWCNNIEDDPPTSKANCFLPVRGSKASGTVHAGIFAHPGALDVDLSLER